MSSFFGQRNTGYIEVDYQDWGGRIQAPLEAARQAILRKTIYDTAQTLDITGFMPCLTSDLSLVCRLNLLKDIKRYQQIWALFIAFCPVVRDTKHSTVANIRHAAVAPCGNMVCVHFFQLIDTVLVAVMSKCAKRAIRNTLRRCVSHLSFVNGAFCHFIKNTNVKQLCIGAAA